MEFSSPEAGLELIKTYSLRNEVIDLDVAPNTISQIPATNIIKAGRKIITKTLDMLPTQPVHPAAYAPDGGGLAKHCKYRI